MFLFPGQGFQRTGMGSGLYSNEPVYRDLFDECAGSLLPDLGFDIRGLIHGTPGHQDSLGSMEGDRTDLRQTVNAQPALFVVEYALARLLMSRGAIPQAMLGHSVGDLVAACLAGVFSLKDGLRLVAARSRLMQQCAPGSMVAVVTSETGLSEILAPDIELAAANAPNLHVLSGPVESIRTLMETLAARGVPCQALDTAHAFHSWMMEPALPEFRNLMEDIPLLAPRIPVISNATGRLMTPQEATNPAYWSDHIRNTVRFSAGLIHLLDSQHPVFLETGPGVTLTDLVRRHDRKQVCLPSLGKTGENQENMELHAVFGALGRAWCAGARVDWAHSSGTESHRMVDLPTYPFQRRRHWIQPQTLPTRWSDEEIVYTPGWRPMDRVKSADCSQSRNWLIFSDDLGVADALTRILREGGSRVVTVSPGDSFATTGIDDFTIRPGSKEDLIVILESLTGDSVGGVPLVAHAWCVSGSREFKNDLEAFEHQTPLGFHSLVALIRAAFFMGFCENLSIGVIADGMAVLDGESAVLRVEKAPLIAPCRVVVHEIDAVSMRCMDIPPVSKQSIEPWLPESIIQEILAGGEHHMIALRSSGRFVEELQAIESLPSGGSGLRDGGVVFITGGVGGLALVLADELFEIFRARLVLTTRWNPPPRSEWSALSEGHDRKARALRGVLDLEAKGAEVMLVKADVTNLVSLRQAVSQAQDRFGPTHGVVHAAGALSQKLLIDTTAESADLVFQAMVRGAFNLEQMFADLPLDFFIQLSSQFTHVPTRGQAAYLAANAVQSMLAHRRSRTQPGLSCAIGWGAWHDVGMAAGNAALSSWVQDEGGGVAWDEGRGVFDSGPTLGDPEPLLHPLLFESRRHEKGRHVYRGRVGPGDWVAEEHQYKGRPLLSGTTLCECIRAAFAHRTGSRSLELSQIAFLRPLFVDPAGQDLQVVFEPVEEGARFLLRSRPEGSHEGWAVHAIGDARGLKAKVPRVMQSRPADWAGQPDSIGRHASISMGPRWDCVEQFEGAGDASWGQVKLKESFQSDLKGYDLHPALFDVAQGLASHRFENQSIPFSIDRILIHGKLGRNFQSTACGVVSVTRTSLISISSIPRGR